MVTTIEAQIEKLLFHDDLNAESFQTSLGDLFLAQEELNQSRIYTEQKIIDTFNKIWAAYYANQTQNNIILPEPAVWKMKKLAGIN